MVGDFFQTRTIFRYVRSIRTLSTRIRIWHWLIWAIMYWSIFLQPHSWHKWIHSWWISVGINSYVLHTGHSVAGWRLFFCKVSHLEKYVTNKTFTFSVKQKSPLQQKWAKEVPEYYAREQEKRKCSVCEEMKRKTYFISFRNGKFQMRIKTAAHSTLHFSTAHTRKFRCHSKHLQCDMMSVSKNFARCSLALKCKNLRWKRNLECREFAEFSA